MTSAMDKAMLAMSLDEEEDEVPFVMPDLPQFSSSERNVNSLIGRLLNPDCQKLSSLIIDMPRKWQKYDRVRGVALTRERFQFIFKYEHDLLEILGKGHQTYNEWSLAIEKWVERPSPEFLQFTTLWVQISNIPVNFFTEQAISKLGEIIGLVKTVAFDPDKALVQGYVRVEVLFDISKPLRRSKSVLLPTGEYTTVFFFYEKVQRRCLHCQRLTHAKEVCPFLLNKRSPRVPGDSNIGSSSRVPMETVLKPGDPLFGVLEESQVGLNPTTGRPRIAADVLEGMRQYLLVSSNEERIIREARVKKTVKEAEQDPIAQKLVLQLEPPPVFTRDVNKGKGLVFGYDSATEDSSTQSDVPRPSHQKLMAASVIAAPELEYHPAIHPSLKDLTVYKFNSSRGKLPGVNKSQGKNRRRLNKGSRKQISKGEGSGSNPLPLKQGLEQGEVVKRKAVTQLEVASKAARLNASEMVPKEGPSTA